MFPELYAIGTITDASWCQAQLPLHLGGWDFGSSPKHHANAVFIASYSLPGCCNNEDAHLNRAIDMFNEHAMHIL